MLTLKHTKEAKENKCEQWAWKTYRYSNEIAASVVIWTTVLNVMNNWALSGHSCSKRRRLSITDYSDGMCSGQRPQSRCLRHETVVVEKWSSSSCITWPGQTPSPLGLLLLHDLLALLSPAFIDGVAWVVDLEGVLVLHVGILDFSALLIKLQHMAQPKSDGESSKESDRGATKSPALTTFTQQLWPLFAFSTLASFTLHAEVA